MCVACGCEPLARSKMYECLAATFLYPDPPIIDFLVGHLAEFQACSRRLGDRASARCLATLIGATGSLSASDWQDDYLKVFGHSLSKECPPYETEYGLSHLFQQSQAMADVAGFYAAFGLQLSPSFMDRLDHISVELEFMQFLALKEAHAAAQGHPEDKLALCREAQRKFLADHLGQWAFSFLRRLRAKAPTGIYHSWTNLAETYMRSEMRRFALQPQDAVAPARALLPMAEEAFLCPVADPIGGVGR